MIKLSIITVSFNAANTIECTIQCILNQTYENIEYIIIDGQSTDGTIQIINKYRNKITKVIVEPDQGIYYAMNKGIDLATGEVIGFLNADDEYLNTDVLKNVMKRIVINNYDSLYGDLIYIKETKVTRKWHAGKYKLTNFKYGWMPPHPTFFVKKNIYQRYGLFNTSLRISADYELMLRFLFAKKISCLYYPKVLVKMNVGGKSNKSVGNRLIANEEDTRAWVLNGLKMPFYTRFLKPILKIKQFFT